MLKNSAIAASPTNAHVRPFYLQATFLIPFSIVVLSLVPRLILMPLFTHGDIIVLAWSARPLALGSWNLYDKSLEMWINDANWNQNISPNTFGPLFYYPYGIWLWIAEKLTIFPLVSWKGPNLAPLTALNLFALKVPLLVADYAAAFFVSRIFAPAKRNLALALWLFAPMTLYFNYTTGQIDVMMTVFICAGLYFAAQSLKRSRREFEAGITQAFFQKEAVLALTLLSVGACVKLFTIFYIPFVVLILSKRAGRSLLEDYKRVGMMLGFGLLPVAVIFLPLSVISKTFLPSVLGSVEGSLLAALAYGNGFGLVSIFWLFFFALLAFLLFDGLNNRARQYNFNTLITALAGVTLFYLIFCSYPLQLMTWSMPIFIVMIVQRPRLFWGYLILTACQVLIAVTIYPNNLDLKGLWSHFASVTLNSTGTVWDFLSKSGFSNQLQSWTAAIGTLNVIVMFLLYRRSVSEPLFDKLSLFRKRNEPETLEELDQETQFRSAHEQTVINAADPAHPDNGTVLPHHASRVPVWIIAAAPAVLFFGLLFGLTFVGVSASGERLLSQDKAGASTAANLLPGTTVRQDFVAPAGQLEKVEIVVVAPDQLIASNLNFTLYQNGVTSPIQQTRMGTLYLKSNIYYQIKLDHPLKLDQATPLYFTLSSPDSKPGQSLSISNASWVTLTPGLQKQISPLQVNGYSTEKVMQFRLDYGVNWGQWGQIIGNYLGRTPAFSVGSLLLGLLLAVLGIAGLVVASRTTGGKPSGPDSAPIPGPVKLEV